MSWNDKTYIQEINGQVTEIGGLIQELGPLNTYFTEPRNSANITCKHCGTTYKYKEAKQGHCPYCLRLI
jgi:hypothetical protein